MGTLNLQLISLLNYRISARPVRAGLYYKDFINGARFYW